MCGKDLNVEPHEHETAAVDPPSAALDALRGGPGSIPRSVISLIAGLALTDAAFVAARAGTPGVLACFACFGLTLALQRRIRGT